MTPKGADLAATDLIEVSTLEAGSYVTKSITGQELIDAIPLPPSGLTIGTTPIASGTIGRVLFEGTGNVLQQSANLFWDGTNERLGIGTETPENSLDVNGDIGIRKISSGAQSNSRSLVLKYEDNTAANHSLSIFARPTGTNTNFTVNDTRNNQLLNVNTGAISWNNGGAIITRNSSVSPYIFSGTSPINFHTGSSVNTSIYSNLKNLYFGTEGTTGSKQLGIFTTGNVLIQNGGTFTDAGFTLDVNGTARFSGNLTIDPGYTLFTPTISSTNVLRIDSAAVLGVIRMQGNQIGMGNNTTGDPSALLTLTSTTKGFLPPRMTTTQRNAIASPAAGLIVYDTTLNLPHFFNGTIWVSL